MFPASAIVFFYHGPLAWNGVFALYLPLALFALWYNVTAFWLLRAIRQEGRIVEPEEGDSPARPQGESDLTRHRVAHA